MCCWLTQLRLVSPQHFDHVMTQIVVNESPHNDKFVKLPAIAPPLPAPSSAPLSRNRYRVLALVREFLPAALPHLLLYPAHATRHQLWLPLLLPRPGSDPRTPPPVGCSAVPGPVPCHATASTAAAARPPSPGLPRGLHAVGQLPGILQSLLL